MEDINKRIKMLRESLNLSQEGFGNTIGLSKSGISNIESGVRNVTDKHIKLIGNELNVNEEWLRTGEGAMFNETDLDGDLAYAMGKISALKNDELKKALLMLTELTDEQLIYLSQLIKALKGDTK